MKSNVIIKLIEDRPRKRGSKISEADLKRLAQLAEDNVKMMEKLDCLKFKGGVIYYKTNCFGNYYPE